MFALKFSASLALASVASGTGAGAGAAGALAQAQAQRGRGLRVNSDLTEEEEHMLKTLRASFPFPEGMCREVGEGRAEYDCVWSQIKNNTRQIIDDYISVWKNLPKETVSLVEEEMNPIRETEESLRTRAEAVEEASYEDSEAKKEAENKTINKLELEQVVDNAVAATPAIQRRSGTQTSDDADDSALVAKRFEPATAGLILAGLILTHRIYKIGKAAAAPANMLYEWALADFAEDAAPPREELIEALKELGASVLFNGISIAAAAFGIAAVAGRRLAHVEAEMLTR